MLKMKMIIEFETKEDCYKSQAFKEMRDEIHTGEAAKEMTEEGFMENVKITLIENE